MISAAPFRDRVVHHALTGALEPVFERRFSPNSYACRRGKGTQAALERVRNYFASIDHRMLNTALERVMKCLPTLDLAGGNAPEDIYFYFSGE